MMTSRPGLAKTILADVVPRKNFPIKVPWLFHTYLQSFSNEFSGSGWRDADLYSVSTSWVHISIKINLNTVSNACIDIGKSSAIFKHICLRIDIESVPGNYTAFKNALSCQNSRKLTTLQVQSDYAQNYTPMHLYLLYQSTNQLEWALSCRSLIHTYKQSCRLH